MADTERPYVVPLDNPTVSQVLLRYLALEGVKHLFGVPGGGVANMLLALKDARDDFQYIVCRHETGAAYMADGYFRATGRLGAVLVTSGPGATNALTGAMNAHNGGSALMVISGEVAEAYYGMGYLQEGIDADLNVDQIYLAATRYSAVIADQSQFQTLFTQALRNALSIPRRAVHLSLPNNVAAEPMGKITLPARPENYRAVPAGAPPDQVRQALTQLLAARRPLLFLGNGCREPLRRPGLLAKLEAFVERYGIPVMTTSDGKGVFPENHAMSLRVYGFADCMWPQYWLVPSRLGSAVKDPPPYDGLLVLGSTLGELATNTWNPMLVPRGPLIQVDLDQRVIARAFHVSQGIVGEIGAFIEDVDALAPEFPPDAAAVRERKDLVALIKKLNSPFSAPDQYVSQAGPIEPAAVVRVLQETLPADSLVLQDAGNCVGWGVHYFAFDPPREIQSSLSMGPMGFAVGAVVGAKLGRPDRTCVALTGDGAFLMHGAEVSTAQHYKIGAIWVVLHDDDLRMVSQGMEHYFPDSKDPDVWNQLYRLGRPDLVKLAEGLGADAYGVSSPAEMAAIMPKVLTRANSEGRPQVVVAHINPKSSPPYYLPQYTPGAPVKPARSVQ